MKKEKGKGRRSLKAAREELAKKIYSIPSLGLLHEDKLSQDVDLQAVLHDLEVSQIELEVQNRELIESRMIVEASHDRYVNLYDFAPVAYVTLNCHGNILELNLAAANLFGMERQSLVNQPMSLRVLRDDVRKFRDHLRQGYESEKVTSETLRLVSKDKTVTPVQLVSRCIHETATGDLILRTAITDLTEQTRAEKERQLLMTQIEGARKELFNFFMQAPAPMAILTGPRQIHTLANEPYVRFVGCDVMGKTAREVFSGTLPTAFSRAIERVFKTGEPYVGKELSHVRKESSGVEQEIFVNLSCTAFKDNEEGIRGVLVFGQDVTDQVLARRRLESEKERDRSYQEDLKREKLRAERANEAKSAFLANMSHEIRTPLGAILGFTELITLSDCPDERERMSEIVIRNGKALTKLIDDILDLSKVEAGKLELEKINFDIHTLVKDIVGLFHEVVEKKKIELRVEISPVLSQFMIGDPTRIRQILINLLGNAVKFTKKGYVSVQVLPDFTSGELSSIRFVIEDTGIGMTDEQASRLFEPFSQADNTTTRKFGGSGLGLALSRRLATALGGYVKVQKCQPGKGCTFVAAVSAHAGFFPEEARSLTGVQSSFAFRKRSRVLLVEDSIDNQVFIKRLLTKEGFVVDVANNGAEGVEMAEANDYDIVLMDMQMPVLDGYAATEQLRHDGYSKPIVAITAHAMREDRNRILNLGCNAHLTKPLDMKLLVETIDQI